GQCRRSVRASVRRSRTRRCERRCGRSCTDGGENASRARADLLASPRFAMLDLARLERIRLTPSPRFQRVVAYALLRPNYELPPRVDIVFEGQEKVPNEPVIFAMNHTDRYNYWPFQYSLWRRTGRFTATWVKG